MKIWKRFRSAVTGRFVKKQEAEENPGSTVSETASTGSTYSIIQWPKQ
jgi:hypothetical protein